MFNANTIHKATRMNVNLQPIVHEIPRNTYAWRHNHMVQFVHNASLLRRHFSRITGKQNP